MRATAAVSPHQSAGHDDFAASIPESLDRKTSSPEARVDGSRRSSSGTTRKDPPAETIARWPLGVTVRSIRCHGQVDQDAWKPRRRRERVEYFPELALLLGRGVEAFPETRHLPNQKAVEMAGGLRRLLTDGLDHPEFVLQRTLGVLQHYACLKYRCRRSCVPLSQHFASFLHADSLTDRAEAGTASTTVAADWITGGASVGLSR